MVYKEITVDVWRKPNEEVRVIQEEAEGRALVVHVFDSAAPLDLSQKSVFVYIQKPDDKCAGSSVGKYGQHSFNRTNDVGLWPDKAF